MFSRGMPGRVKGTPILLPDGADPDWIGTHNTRAQLEASPEWAFDFERIAQGFEADASGIDPTVTEFVRVKFREFLDR